MISPKVRRNTRQHLKTRKFSDLHIVIFEHILMSGKTNCDLNIQFGYSKNSHAIVDHSRKAMFKLLAMANLSRSECQKQIVYPRAYRSWWEDLLKKHKGGLMAIAIQAEYYDRDISFNYKMSQKAVVPSMT